MEEAGHAIQKPAREDGRRRLITLTEDGTWLARDLELESVAVSQHHEADRAHEARSALRLLSNLNVAVAALRHLEDES